MKAKRGETAGFAGSDYFVKSNYFFRPMIPANMDRHAITQATSAPHSDIDTLNFGN